MAKTPPPTYPITTRALLGRLRRHLAKERKQLKACRPSTRAHGELGDFYVVNGSNYVERLDIDLEKYGRELGVLQPFERLEEK